jgi:PHS family inorganic phosphate transporter-like MFS transporter
MLLGIFTSLLVPETARKTLEQLAGEVPGTPEYDPEISGRRPSNNATNKLAPEQQV